MSGAGRAPAAKQDVEADDQIDQPNGAQAQLQAAVDRLWNNLNRGFQWNPVADNCVVDLSVRAGAVKGALQI